MSARGSVGLLQLVSSTLTIASEDAVFPSDVFSRLAYAALQVCCSFGDTSNAVKWGALLRDWTRASGKYLADSLLPTPSDLGVTLMGPVGTFLFL